jgi:hypothetical protein
MKFGEFWEKPMAQNGKLETARHFVQLKINKEKLESLNKKRRREFKFKLEIGVLRTRLIRQKRVSLKNFISWSTKIVCLCFSFTRFCLLNSLTDKLCPFDGNAENWVGGLEEGRR